MNRSFIFIGGSRLPLGDKLYEDFHTIHNPRLLGSFGIFYIHIYGIYLYIYIHIYPIYKGLDLRNIGLF